MAVPPTPVGSVGPRSTSRSTVLAITAAALAVVSVACLVVLGLRFNDTSGSFGERVRQVVGAGDGSTGSASDDDDKTRELILSRASQFIIRLNTYGPQDLDKQFKMPDYVTRVSEMISPKLATSFQESVTLAEQSVADSGLDRSAQLYSSGAASIEGDSAVVLVTGAVTQSYPDPEQDGRVEYEPELFRIEVGMVKIDGQWLADSFAPVQGEVAGEPSPGVPTEDPTTGAGDPSADPSPSTASPTVKRFVQVVTGRRAGIDAAVTAYDRCGFPDPIDATDAACAAAPGDLGTVARGLAVRLRDAVDPASPDYIGATPSAFVELVPATRKAAGDLVTAAAALRTTCLTSEVRTCATQRQDLTLAASGLLNALDTWDALR